MNDNVPPSTWNSAASAPPSDHEAAVGDAEYSPTAVGPSAIETAEGPLIVSVGGGGGGGGSAGCVVNATEATIWMHDASSYASHS